MDQSVPKGHLAKSLLCLRPPLRRRLSLLIPHTQNPPEVNFTHISPEKNTFLERYGRLLHGSSGGSNFVFSLCLPTRSFSRPPCVRLTPSDKSAAASGGRSSLALAGNPGCVNCAKHPAPPRSDFSGETRTGRGVPRAEIERSGSKRNRGRMRARRDDGVCLRDVTGRRSRTVKGPS